MISKNNNRICIIEIEGECLCVSSEGERQGDQHPLFSYNEVTFDSLVLLLGLGGWTITTLMSHNFCEKIFTVSEYE